MPPHLRAIPGGKLERSVQERLDALETSFATTIRSLEARLDEALKNASAEVRGSKLEGEIERALVRIESRLKKELDGSSSDLAEQINRLLASLDTDATRQKLQKLRLRLSGGDVDAYGKDPVVVGRAEPVLDFLFRRWFRTQVSGVHHVPKTGRVMFVANRGGLLPLDALLLQRAAKRETRPLLEDAAMHFPFLGVWLNRLGAVRACRENAERLLNEDRAVAIFPEGQKGVEKPFSQRYTLGRFARGGFVKIAQATRTKIVPVAIVGPEDSYPLIGRVTWIVKALGVPFLPITPLFPWLGAVGLLPLPAKWHIRFGEPIMLGRARVPEATERVRAKVQQLLDEARAERGEPFKI